MLWVVRGKAWTSVVFVDWVSYLFNIIQNFSVALTLPNAILSENHHFIWKINGNPTFTVIFQVIGNVYISFVLIRHEIKFFDVSLTSIFGENI